MHTRLDKDYKGAGIFSPVRFLRWVMIKRLAASVDRYMMAPQAVLAPGHGSSGTASGLKQ